MWISTHLSLDNIIYPRYYFGMSKANKYSIQNLRKDFPTDEACLEFLFKGLHSEQCSCGGTYKKVAKRLQYQCSKCRFQIAPMAGTIFEKSSTPLTLWFHALFIFSNAKSGISAKEMERQLGVTYKTAWRILKLIREALQQSSDKLSGDVEMDEGYFGGKHYAGKNNKNLGEAMRKKSIVIAAIERNGNAKVEVAPDVKATTLGEFLDKNVAVQNTRLMTDGNNNYKNIAKGYDRHMVNHKRRQFASGDIHVNHVETFWAHVKRSTKGTHKVISKKYLQSYLDAFVFHYNNRGNDRERFEVLLGTLLLGAKS